jgi:hypothetical protein
MSRYAHVNDGAIVEFVEIPDELHALWVASGNPKKDAYRIAVTVDAPAVTDAQVAESSWQVNASSVDQVWSVRDKTADELRKSWTAYQFLLRFTAAERAAFRASALTDANVADFQQLAQAAQEVVNDDPMTVAGMNYLVSVGLLTEQRKQEILG